MKELLILGFYKPEDKINAHLLEHLIYNNGFFASKKYKYVDVGSGYIRLLLQTQTPNTKSIQNTLLELTFLDEEIEKQRNIVISELLYKLKTASHETVYQLLENNLVNKKAYLEKIYHFASKPLATLRKELERLLKEIRWSLALETEIDKQQLCNAREITIAKESKTELLTKQYELISFEEINYIMPIQNFAEAVLLNELHTLFANDLKDINQNAGTYTFSHGIYLVWNNRIINHFAGYPINQQAGQFNNLIYNTMPNFEFEDSLKPTLIKKIAKEIKKRKWYDKVIELADFGVAIDDDYPQDQKLDLKKFWQNKISNSQIVLTK